ncbi:unnamed protein product [Trichobilharzia regenti]|nr:unnamed protein product [Trichobilharzia regenti]
MFQFLTIELQNLNSEKLYSSDQLSRTNRVNSELEFTSKVGGGGGGEEEVISIDDPVSLDNDDGEIDWAAEASHITSQCVMNVTSALEALTNVIRHNTGRLVN